MAAPAAPSMSRSGEDEHLDAEARHEVGDAAHLRGLDLGERDDEDLRLRPGGDVPEVVDPPEHGHGGQPEVLLGGIVVDEAHREVGGLGVLHHALHERVAEESRRRR